MSATELQTVLDKLNDLQRDVAAIKEELAEARGQGLKAKVQDLETRVRSLERWVWGLAGSLALAGVALAFVAKLIP